MRFALFEPDIPQNAGAILRLAACIGFGVDLVEPLGFVWSDKRVRRAGMDYLDAVDLQRHQSWQTFDDTRRADGRRLLLLTTQGSRPYTACTFTPNDVLILGRESAGVPVNVHDAADERLLIPMVSGMRSLNMVTAAAMVAGEALRQLSSTNPASENETTHA